MQNNKPVIEKRSAGVLLHITSLPSPYGIGDLGPEAVRFASFLKQSRQQYWQMLPLNAVEKQQGFSPYSATSAMAGNILLISPDLLRGDGLLTRAETSALRLPAKSTVPFNTVVTNKRKMLELAWSRKASISKKDFSAFCQEEKEWIDDFACYQLLKDRFKGKPWFQWPAEFRLRKSNALKTILKEQASDLDRIKWYQFLFFRQWSALKSYCNDSGIRMFGDLPFYISYDSVDVWSNRDGFKLDKSGGLAGIAGVPPDYFNRNGQLWGMPVFRWDVMQRNGYQWWIERIRKNLQLFDLVRLDHFRAFAAYWEVPGGQKTAVKGSWKPGPGTAFFKVLQKNFPGLPFVAEDLGDITADVYQLRDQFRLPGMKVLQFAFGDNLSDSDHIPHNFTRNFVAYTGTHDNNTTQGWYCRESDKAQRHRIAAYTGEAVSQKNVHRVLTRLVYASVAGLAIVPMQDLLGLNEGARMNTPASTTGNWSWRLKPGDVRRETGQLLRKWTGMFGRASD